MKQKINIAAGEPSAKTRALVARRQALLGPSYRLFYQQPLHPVRAEGVWLYDDAGNALLDAYNNVPSVGHCHPQVVAAIAAQAAQLNTHTRYLGEQVLNYSERLLATFPAAINRIMYTCTGSEAVDLALRIARSHTGGSGIVITANAYHGVTAAAAEISPSLGENVALGQHVVTVPAPDSYRAAGGDVAKQLATDVASAFAFLRRRGIKPAAFIADGIFSSDGIFTEPAGFLQQTLEVVHGHGALYIADEVQPGFGRTGSHMWGFQRHGIVPDMVVIGKPMGNGLPIAATLFKEEIQRKFAESARYFNTFGANHISIAAATAVLDIIEEEQLMENAVRTGEYMLAGMRSLQQKYRAVGDVRGAGLFLALELVQDDGQQTPDGEMASAVVNLMRDNGVLVSSAGPAANILKIRPPLPFNREHADIFLRVLDRVLDELS
ncbi:4-aminobutyrate aminotransferase-like enzyme [Erwinia toletana]|uniref:4-aminobutyrate aminotransferase-like enzyme n=1 Tax=Winslowiella toletana TaxID=92490 RepID=A0ABS4PFI4_9GAMM|nr:aspartate aminotransferase family protein [Winslowiella toletana]MBP2171392.1 4-aminobutyrate aminotransferase-like enzyme [Winslowiella toletana]